MPALAQFDCPQLVIESLQAMGDNCTELNRNNACYGYDRVEASFYETQPEGTFTEPADRASLLDMQSLQTYAFDEETQFGVAAMNVQANVPNTLPGQGVIFLLLGDANVSNAVNPQTIVPSIDTIPVPVAVNANLFSDPSEAADIVLTAPQGELLPLDGLTPQKTWARTIVNDVVLWVHTADLVQSAALNALPTIGSSQRTPMQSFYFSTGLGTPRCNEADSVIAIQSPQGLKIDMTVNGVDIRVGSMLTLRSLDENSLLLTVHRGQVQTTSGQLIHANESIMAELGVGGNIVRWDTPQAITEEAYEQGTRVQEALNVLARANDWREYDVAPLAPPEPTATPTDMTTMTPAPGITPPAPQGDVYHIVAPGENLYRIALYYEASMPAIVEANQLPDPTSISVGQRLLIPNAGSGFVSIDLPTPTATTADGGATASCSNFALIYPTTDVSVGDTLYQWTAVPGATRYEVVFYNYEGILAQTYPAQEPQIYLNTGRIPTGSELYWEVRAYANDTYLCVTPRSGKITRYEDQ